MSLTENRKSKFANNNRFPISPNVYSTADQWLLMACWFAPNLLPLKFTRVKAHRGTIIVPNRTISRYMYVCGRLFQEGFNEYSHLWEDYVRHLFSKPYTILHLTRNCLSINARRAFHQFRLFPAFEHRTSLRTNLHALFTSMFALRTKIFSHACNS